jgi:hypothetical protein
LNKIRVLHSFRSIEQIFNTQDVVLGYYNYR